MHIDSYSSVMDEIVDRDQPLTQIARGMSFGEGPVWDQKNGCLYFVDIIDSKIYRWRPGIGLDVHMSSTGHANGMTLDREGRLVVAGWSSRTIWRLEHDGSTTTLASHYEGKKINTPNDIVIRSDGSIYWTDSDGGLLIPGMEGEDSQRYLDFSGVFCIPPGGKDIRPILTDDVFPNGLAFSPDEKKLYVNDTRLRHIRAFDVNDDGSVRNPKVHYQLIGDEVGHADGMKVDINGNLFCTGPAGIHILDPSGKLLGRLRIPEDCTNMAWGDDDLMSLFITTFHAVFRIRLKTSGLPLI
jgi:gluconolactonase